MAAAPKEKVEADTGSTAVGSKKKLFLMIGVAIALVALSVGGTVVALKVLAPSANEDSAAANEEQPPIVLAPAIYFEMTPNFTINFNANGRQRYLQAAITLLYRDPLLEELLTLHMPAIRNGLVMLLSSKQYDELQTVEGKEILRAEALKIIRNQLQKEQDALVASGQVEEPSSANVEQVLFTTFVMQ